MSGSAIDVLMRIQGAAGPYPGEASTTFTVPEGQDKLRAGFKEGFFSELQEFSFSAGVESALKSPEEIARERADRERKEKERQHDADYFRNTGTIFERKKGSETSSSGSRAKMNRMAKRGASEFVDMRPVEFTRIFDSSSTLLFTALTQSETLPSLTVIKRKAGGASASGLTYLRLEFRQVLITDLTWKDATHVVVETGTFIYRELTVIYAPQNPDGTLRPSVEESWTMRSAR